MSNLRCAALDCRYNNEEKCYAGGIRIDGKNATTTCNTHCISFEPKTHTSMENSLNATNIVSTASVECRACKCHYNKSGLCSANLVKINSSNESCDTFSCH
ncbi:MAG: DUF1540 domain-containing protein [Peptostreptococcaceae bacterium]